MTLQPLLIAAADWIAPQGLLDDPAPRTHFGIRAAERGVSTLPGDLLKWVVERALFLDRGDLVELVFRIDQESRLFRIILPEGMFFPVVSQRGNAVTIYTTEMVRKARADRRWRLAKHGCRQRSARVRA